MSNVKMVVCPYCGETQQVGERCRSCNGRYDPLSRQATHNEMGPWYIRTPERQFLPGCAYETLVRLIEKGAVTRFTIVRGPTTKQFWTVAKRVPGLAHLLGYCHECDGRVDPSETNCPHCRVAFGAYLDRDLLGLPEVRVLPGDAPGGDESGAPIGGYARGPVPHGLSSFARDDELFGQAAVATAPAPVQITSEDDSGPTESQILASPAVRALQRRIARQDRTVRILVLVILVTSLVGVGFNLYATGRFDGMRGETADADVTGDGDVGADADADSGARADGGAGADGASGASGGAGGVGGAAGAPGGAGGADGSAGTGADGAAGAGANGAPGASGAGGGSAPVVDDARLTKAAELVDSAEDVTLADVERLRRLEEALQLYEEVANDMPNVDLDDRIARLHERIERLRLKEFFGG